MSGCTSCGNALWAARSRESGLCSNCHPDGPVILTENWPTVTTQPDKTDPTEGDRS